MLLFGTAGPAGAGKDTVADYLVLNHGFVKMSFAGPLKEMLALVGFSEPADRAQKELPVPGFAFTWRQAAQALGTEWGRALDPDIWTKIMAQRLHTLQAAQEHWVGVVPRIIISDVRFENEGKMLRDLGGSIIHLMGRKVDLGAAAAHVSETGVLYHPSRDHLVDNAGSRIELHEQIEMVLKAENA